MFLGGTLGNFPPQDRERFLASLAAALHPGETLLLGVDLVKDPARLVAAYDDASGVTADFNRNVLRVLNRVLDANFEPEAFEHVAIWDAGQEWIEMRLRAPTPMAVYIAALDLDIKLDAGEEIRTEISAKFRHEQIEKELAAAGLRPEGLWTDNDFALVLARR